MITDSKRKSQHGIEARKLKKAKDSIESPHAIEARGETQGLRASKCSSTDI